MRTPSTVASPFGIPAKRRAAPPAISAPTHRTALMRRSDAQAALLGGEIELGGERTLDHEALDASTRALLEVSAAPVAHHEIVSQLRVGDASHRRLLVRAAAE